MKKHSMALAALLLGIGMASAPVYAQTQVPVDTGIAGSLSSDTRASGVAVSSTSVGMTYPIKAKLFGILPVTLSAQVQVQSDGSVAIHYPWYAFLFSTDQAELQTKLEAVGQAANAWNTSVFTEKQQSALLLLVHAALESNFGASANAAGSVQ